MRERGKGVDTSSDEFSEFNYSSAPEMQCKKHPNSSSVGICSFCLKERLVKLVCSECGEQRLSSCSCSDVSSSHRNSCSTVEIGSVGRVSFLIENEKIDPNPKSKTEENKVIFLRRSSSSCVEVKKTNGFWKIKRLFKKKRTKKDGELLSDEKSEIWVSDAMGVSRSRSLCSFRNGGVDEGSECRLSSAKISDVTSGIFMDCDKQFGFFNETDQPRRSWAKRGGGQNCVEGDRAYRCKESDFKAMDESAFIDLKLDLSTESRELGGGRISDCKNDIFESGGSLAGLKSNGVGSCRITVNERGLKRGSRSHKVWKWIFKYNSASKKEI